MFDLEAARKAGYGDDVIARALAQEQGVNFEAALKAGYSPSDMLPSLIGSMKEPGMFAKAGAFIGETFAGEKSVADKAEAYSAESQERAAPGNLAPLSEAGYSKIAGGAAIAEPGDARGIIARATTAASTDEDKQAELRAVEDTFSRAEAEKKQEQEQYSQFKRETPNLAAFASGTRSLAASFADIPQLSNDLIKQVAINPFLHLFGKESLEPTARFQIAKDFEQAGKDYMPEIAKKSLSELNGAGEVGSWIAAQAAMQSPQIIASTAAALIPKLRAAYLGIMGLSSGASNYQESLEKGVNQNTAMRGGLTNAAFEVIGESLPFGVFDSVGKYIKNLPLPQRGAVIADALKKTMLVVGAGVAQQAAEGIGEGVTQIGQNASERYVIGDKSVGLMDRVPEAVAIGAIMGTPTAIAQSYRTARNPSDILDKSKTVAESIDIATSIIDDSLDAHGGLMSAPPITTEEVQNGPTIAPAAGAVDTGSATGERDNYAGIDATAILGDDILGDGIGQPGVSGEPMAGTGQNQPVSVGGDAAVAPTVEQVGQQAKFFSPREENAFRKIAFNDPHEERLNRHFSKARDSNIPLEHAKALVPEQDLDHVTGYFRGEDKAPTVERAQKFVEDTGTKAHYVEADVANLGGINAHFNNSAVQANKVYRAIADIFKAEMEKAGQRAVMIRQGGDEVNAVIIGGTDESIKAAMASTQKRIKEYTDANGLSDIKNPKGGLPGTGLHLGFSSILPSDNINDIFDAASKDLDASKQKKGQENVTGKEGGSTGIVPPTGKPGGIPESTGTEGAGNRSAESQEPAGIPAQKAKQSAKPVKKRNKAHTLLTVLRGKGLKLDSKLDVAGNKFAPGGYNQVFKTEARNTIEGLAGKGELDEFLPYELRFATNDQAGSEVADMQEAVEWLKDKIRAGERVIPYDAQMELEQRAIEAQALIDAVEEELSYDEINAQLQLASNEEREDTTNARIFNPGNEESGVERGTGTEAGESTGAETGTNEPAYQLQSQTNAEIAAKEARAQDTTAEDKAAADRAAEVPLTLATQSQEKTDTPSIQAGMFTPDGRATVAAESSAQAWNENQEDIVFEEGKGKLGRGKWIARSGEISGNMMPSKEEAEKSLREILGAQSQFAAQSEKVVAAQIAVANKLKAGENPSFNEWKSAFPQLRNSDTYLRQPEISPFLIEHFGLKRNAIKTGIGKAAGDITSDMGAKYPIVYFNRLADVLDQPAIEAKPTDEVSKAKAEQPTSAESVPIAITNEYAAKWFGTQAKAAEFIKIKNAEATHEVVAVGVSRFEIHLKQVGTDVEQKAAPTKFANNKIFTQSAVDAARARMKKKLSTLNSGIDPEMFQDGVTLAGAYIESGARSFADYSKAMINDLGDAIKPYLRSFYEGVRHYPGLDAKGMTTAVEIDANEAEKAAQNEDPSKESEPEAKQGSHFAAGQSAFNLGLPRVLPSYFSVKTGKNPKDWYRGWDAASLDAKPNAIVAVNKDQFVGRNVDGVALYADKNGVRYYISAGIQIQEEVELVPYRTENGSIGYRYQVVDRKDEYLTAEEHGVTKKPEAENPTDKFTTPTVIDKIVSRLAGDGYKSIMDARGHLMEITGDMIKPGTAEAKRADEAIELAAVVRAREIVTAGENHGHASLDIYNKLVDLYENKMPNLNVRTSTSVEQQAYSTPTPLAYLASKLAGINKTTVVAEPTAGNGALLIATNQNLVFANEMNAGRATALRSQGYPNVSESDGTIWEPGQKVDSVIANPPFGVIRDEDGNTISFKINDQYTTNEIDHAIALKTLDSMKDDGTAVLILGGVNSEKIDVRSDAYNSKAKRAFYFTLYRDYNVTDHFTVSGDMYAKQGAAWPVDVIVIKGRGKSAMQLPAANVPRIINSYAELGKELQNELPTKDNQSVGIVAGQGAVKPGNAGGSGAAVSGSGNGGRVANTQQPSAMPGSASNTERVDTVSNRADNKATDDVSDSAKPGKRNDTEQSSPGLKRAETKSEAETAGQIHYVPISQTNNIGTLVPKNMGTAITAALTDLEKRVGNIDKYVSEKLDYKLKDLSKYFSAEQVDALGLAIDNIHNGGGFIIGDQTGVGKGRIVAGLIKYAILNGKTPIFVTEKPNLYGDMMRDLNDIGMHDVNPFMTNAGEEIPLDQDASNWLDEKAIAKENGESAPTRYGKFLKTPSNTGKIMQDMMSNGSLGAHRAIFTTYSQMQTVKGARTDRQNFLDSFSDGAVVIFDESHNAGGTEAGGRGKKPAEGDMPEGRSGFARAIAAKAHGVFYSSATYAKRPSVMSLYFRTSMAKAVKNIKELSGAISAGGVPLQQVVATMLAKAGQYMRRERSFAGVEYNVKESIVDKKIAEDASTIFRAINKFDSLKKAGIKEMHEQAKKEAKQISENGMAGGAGVESQNFTSVLHNNISQLLLALKAKDAVEKSLEALKNGERVVLTLSNTMGSFIEEYVTDNDLKSGDSIDLSYSDLLLRYLEKARMVTIKDPFGNSEKHRLTDDELGEKAANFWKATRAQIQAMDFSGLPISPIDYVKSELAKAGYKTGEITGRLHTIDYSGKTPVYRQRPAAEKSIAGRMGMISKFNNGEHDAIVLNQSGATGLSLHASEKFKDKRKRHMIIMQAEANIDTHMQMLGRVHRTGQVITPRYTQLAADIPAEKRPASVLAKKMASLNANTTASAKSALTAEDSLDFMNSYGDEVAFELMQNDPLLNEELGDPSDGETKEDVMRKVTGRIPLLPLAKQAAVYKQLEDAYKELIASHDALGTNKLEAKTLDTDAKTKSKTMVFSTAEPGALTKVSDNPFEQDAYAELVDMKKQGRAYTSQQVIDILKLELGSEANDLGRLRALGEQKAKLMRQEFDAEYSDYSKEYLNDISPERLQAAQERLYSQHGEVVNLLNGIRTGSPVVVNLDGNLIKGIVIKIEHKNGPKNPAALGAWKVSLALADGMRHITIPLTQITHGYQTPDEDKKHISVIRDSGDATLKLFDTAQTSSREERTIITGNILAGFGKFKGGQIVHFTDNNGDMRQGILMPAKFNLEETLAGEPVTLTPDQVAKFLSEGNDRLVSNESEIIKTTRNRNGEYILSVPSSKAEGGVFFLNKKLLGILGQDFIKTGNSMRVTLDSKSQLIAALNVLQEMNQTFITKSFKDEAKKVAGIKDSTNKQAKFSRAQSYPELAAALEKYEGTGELATVQDLANEVDALIGEELAPDSLQAAIEDYRQELADDHAYAGRGDMDAADERFVDAVRAAITAKESRSTQRITNPHTLKSAESAMLDAHTGADKKALQALLDSGKALVITAQQARHITGDRLNMVAWHGSPHDHDKFDSSKIGTGEGAQAYGHGLYFAGNKEVAEYYKTTLSIDKGLGARILKDGPNDYSVWGIKNKGDQQISMLADKLLLGEAHKYKDKWDKDNSGKLYQVELAPSEDEYLLWDRPLSEQSEKVKAALEKAGLFDGSGKAESDYADRYAAAVKKEGGNADAVKQAILNLVRNKEMSDKDWNVLLRENPQPNGFDLNDIHDEYRPAYWRSILNRTTMEREIISSANNGEAAYRELSGGNPEGQNAKMASRWLHDVGIRGIKYLDGSSRGKGEGDFNYVIFDDKDVSITAKYSKDGRALAFFNQQDGATYFIADNIPQNYTAAEWRGLVRHEIGVHAFQLGKDSAEFKDILKQVDMMNKTGNKAVRAAFNRVPDGTAPENITEEAVAYLVQESPELPIVKRIIAWFRNAIRAIGKILPVMQRARFFEWAAKLNENDILYMAQSAMAKSVKTEAQREYSEGVMASHENGGQIDEEGVTLPYSDEDAGRKRYADVVAKLKKLYGGEDGYESLISSANRYIRRYASPSSEYHEQLFAIRKLKAGSEAVQRRLLEQENIAQGSGRKGEAAFATLESRGRSLGHFSGYVTEARLQDIQHYGNYFAMEVWPSEFDGKDGALDSPILTITINPTDDTAFTSKNPHGEIVIYGPDYDSDTYRILEKKGWAEVAKGKDGKTAYMPNGKPWTKLTGSTPAQITAMLAEAHARVRLAIDVPHLGINWDRATGATGYATVDGNKNENQKSAIYFSRQNSLALQGGEAIDSTDWASPTETLLDNVIYKLQDKNIDLKRVIEEIKATGTNIADKYNAYLQEELFHGRAAKRTQDFVNTELKPLINEMRMRGLTIEQLDKYLHARHAKEANALIAERDPDIPDGGSGMTNQQADDYMDGLSDSQKTRLEAAAKRVDEIITKTRDMYASYGLVSKDQTDAWGEMFEHYVPLMREDHDGGMGVGQGFSVKGKEVKHRTGSTAKVVDILANIALQREKAITRGEKNRVTVSLFGLVKLNPNPDFWTAGEVPTERVLNEKTGLVEERIDPMFKSKPNAIVAKIKDSKGKVVERAVIFNEHNERAMRMAKALKNLDAAQMEGLWGVSAKVTRYFASVNTQYNPVFGITNIVRDVQGMALNLDNTALAKHKLDVLKEIPKMLKGIYQDARMERKGRANDSETSQLWEELQDEGGMTGYRDLYRNSEDRANAIKHELDPHNWVNNKWGKVFTAGGMLKVPLTKAQDMAGPIFDWLTDYNQMMEGSTRLAVYKVARENGYSKQQAASLAKNITVNFNRKGQSGQQAGALYAFFNAAMQGTARIGQTIFTMEKGDIKTVRLNKTGKKIVYGGILLGAIQAAALAAAGFDEDEPPEFVRERSLIIPFGIFQRLVGVSKEDASKKYISIPMPLGFHVLPNIGRVATEFSMGGFKDPTDHVIRLMGIFVEAFNPIGSAGLSMQTIAPTPFDPFAALAENRDWTGKHIAKPRFDTVTPGFSHNRDTATTLSRLIAEALNTLSGGDDYTAGAFSPTADQLDYLAGQIGGGVWREGSKLEQSVMSGITGEEMPTHKIPVLGRFYGDGNSKAGQGGAYYSNLQRVKEVEAGLKGRLEDNLPVDKFKLENPEYRLIGRANLTESTLRSLQKRKREMIDHGVPREKVKQVEERITQVMKQFNEAAANLNSATVP